MPPTSTRGACRAPRLRRHRHRAAAVPGTHRRGAFAAHPSPAGDARVGLRGASRIESNEPASRDSGRADAQALARFFEFYAGAADKLHGQTIPYRNGTPALCASRTGSRPHHPVELPDADLRPLGGAALAAGNACVVKPARMPAVVAARGAVGAQAGLPPGALISSPAWREAGPGPRRASRHRTHLVHRFAGTGRRVAQAAAAHTAGHARAGREVAQLVFADADIEAALPFLGRRDRA